jgi:hypothetical protein
MATRTEKLRRRQHRKEKRRRRFSGPVSEFTRSGDIQLIVDSPFAVKMSEVLISLIQPEWEGCANEEEMRKLLTIGAAAWNVALLKRAERAAFTERLALAIPIELRQDFKLVLEPLISRKEQMFPQIRRPIISFELTRLPSGKPYLRVISGLEQPD